MLDFVKLRFNNSKGYVRVGMGVARGGGGSVNKMQDHFFKPVNGTTAHGDTPGNTQTVKRPLTPSQDRQLIAGWPGIITLLEEAPHSFRNKVSGYF